MTDTTAGDPNVGEIATTVETVDEALMRVLPFIAPLLGFVPGAAAVTPFLPVITELLTAVDNAAKAVAAGNPGAAATDVLQEIIKHLTPGEANSPALAPEAAAPA